MSQGSKIKRALFLVRIRDIGLFASRRPAGCLTGVPGRILFVGFFLFGGFRIILGAVIGLVESTSFEKDSRSSLNHPPDGFLLALGTLPNGLGRDGLEKFKTVSA